MPGDDDPVPSMSLEPTVDVAVERWWQEAELHARSGDYDWLAARVPGRRVVEIGCGAGFSTAALLGYVDALLVVEPEARCRGWLGERVADDRLLAVVPASVAGLDAGALAQLADFAPDCVVCWLAGASDAQLGGDGAGNADPVKAYREALHRQVAQLAASLPTVRALQLADRTAFPWQIRDTARDTLVGYHRASTFDGLPFSVERPDALFRKLDVGRWSRELQRRGGLTPVIGSLVARRTN